MEPINYTRICLVYRRFLNDGHEIFVSGGEIFERYPYLHKTVYNINKHRWVKINGRNG